MAVGYFRRTKLRPPKQNVNAEAVSRCGVFHPIVSAGRRSGGIADPLSVSGKLSGMGRSLASAPMAWILQRLE